MPVSSSILPETHAPASDAASIFFVEDEDFIAAMMAVVFERAGLRAIRARDGAEALRLARQYRAEIALAMVDVCLPDIGGDQLCHRLREVCPGLPVLLTSGREMEAFREELEEGGPTAVIAKPFRPAELIKQVRAMLPVAA